MGGDGCGLSAGIRWHLVYGPEIGRWVAGKMGSVFDESSAVALGLQKGNEIQAGVIYENYRVRSIMCHIAINRMTPRFLAYIYDYPFRQLHVDKIVVPVDSDNMKSLCMVKSMGFTEAARLKDASPSGDIVFLTLNKVDCRFIGERYQRDLRA